MWILCGYLWIRRIQWNLWSPTFPIADAMHLGKRHSKDTVLIDRGVFTFWNNKLLITKQNGNISSNRNNAPVPDFESEAPHLMLSSKITGSYRAIPVASKLGGDTSHGKASRTRTIQSEEAIFREDSNCRSTHLRQKASYTVTKQL